MINSPIGDPALIIATLQSALVDLYDLSITGKATHWSVQGGASAMEFLSIHRALDEIIDFAREQYDTVAERIVQLGGFPDGRVGTIAARTPLPQREPGPLTPVEAVLRISATLQLLVERFQTRMGATGRDLVAQNLFIEISTGLQKFSWFWQASVPTQ